jgi:hypothetical protein
VGTITVAPNGLVTFKGTLADGTAVTAASPLSKTKTAALFAQLYVGRTGSWGGQIKLDEAERESDLSGTNFLWFRPYIAGQHYPFGWPEGVTTLVRGAKYTVPTSTSVLPGLAAANPVTGNAELEFSDGQLAASQLNTLNISPADTVIKVPFTDSSYTLTITKAKGEFKGTFNHSNGTKPAFQGVIYQKGTTAGGYGFFLTARPKVINGLGESGGVSLSAK